jgi:hypothetical protein
MWQCGSMFSIAEVSAGFECTASRCTGFFIRLFSKQLARLCISSVQLVGRTAASSVQATHAVCTLVQPRSRFLGLLLLCLVSGSIGSDPWLLLLPRLSHALYCSRHDVEGCLLLH